MNSFFRGTLKMLAGHAKGGKRQEIYKEGFYLGLGIFTGILLNDLWRVFNLPGNNIPATLVTGEQGPKPQVKEGTNRDEFYQKLIGIGTIGVSVIYDYDALLPLGFGILAGVDIANRSEKGEYVGFM
jgi:hypothetical protein